eukprot:4641228-Amphidinium_carterae.1
MLGSVLKRSLTLKPGAFGQNARMSQLFTAPNSSNDVDLLPISTESRADFNLPDAVFNRV